MALDIVPITLAEANEFVKRNHRHHGKVIGHKFSIAVADVETSKIVGVAIVGRPVSRFLDDGWKCIGQAGGLRWTGKRKPEVDLYPAQMKLRYEISLEG